MDLADVHEGLVLELRENVTLVSGGAPMAQLGDTFDELCDRFEALAICHLLELADVSAYRLNLVRAAQARCYFLRRARVEGLLGARHLGLSRTRAVMDALVAGSLGVARAVVALSVEHYDSNREYEDDYQYYLAIHRLVAHAGSVSIAPCIGAFEMALEGAPSSRLALLRALEVRDREAYLAALSELLREEREKVDADLYSAEVQEGGLLYWPRSFVSIEGLALLQVGDLAGLEVARARDTAALPRCPALARVPLDGAVFDDLLEDLALAD